MKNFQMKLVSFLIYAYLNNASVTENSSTSGSGLQSNQTVSSSSNLIDVELTNFFKSSTKQISIFYQLGLSFHSNVENFLVEFIEKYAVKLKQIEV